MMKNDYYNLNLNKKSKISPSQSFYMPETLIKLKYHGSPVVVKILSVSRQSAGNQNNKPRYE